MANIPEKVKERLRELFGTNAVEQIMVDFLTTLVDNKIDSDGDKPMVADLDMNSNKIVNLATPTNLSDAATKAYVDALGGEAVWGGINGNIEDQTDLQDALDAKVPTTSPNFDNSMSINGERYKVALGTCETLSETPNTLFTLATTTDSVKFLEVRIAAYRTGGTAGTPGDSAYYLLKARVKNVGDIVTIVDLVAEESEDQEGWDATLEVGETSIQVVVTGAVDNNITWEATVITQEAIAQP